MRYLTDNEIAVGTFENAVALMKVLVAEGYAVMITTEEKLFIVNYVWCEGGYSNRNYVCFNTRDALESEEE
jgi:hypothetical protein